jgi:hypothetical protein
MRKLQFLVSSILIITGSAAQDYRKIKFGDVAVNEFAPRRTALTVAPMQLFSVILEPVP